MINLTIWVWVAIALGFAAIGWRWLETALNNLSPNRRTTYATRFIEGLHRNSKAQFDELSLDINEDLGARFIESLAFDLDTLRKKSTLPKPQIDSALKALARGNTAEIGNLLEQITTTQNTTKVSRQMTAAAERVLALTTIIEEPITAQSHLERAAQILPRDPIAWVWLGRAARINGNTPTALQAYARALTTSRQHRQQHLRADARLGLGLVHLSLDSPQAAARELARAEHLNRRLGRKHTLAHTLVALGGAHLQRRRWRSARRTLRRALRLAQRLNLTALEINSLTRLGEAYQALGHLKASERSLRRALQLSGRSNFESSPARQLEQLGLLSEKKGDLPSALDYWEEAARSTPRTKSRKRTLKQRPAAL